MARLTEADAALLQAELPPLRHAQLTDGRAVAYREAGARTAPAVVFLHGLGGSSASYRAQFAGLADRWRVIAWDAPGCGDSQALEQTAPTVSDYADRLLAFTESLGIGMFHLAATSWGTLIAADFAGRYPTRVETLTLSGASVGTPPLTEDAMRELLHARLAPSQDGLLGRPPAALVAPDAPAPVLDCLGAMRAAIRPQGYAQAVCMLLATDGMELARRVNRPTMFAVGDVDTVCPPGKHAFRLHGEIAASRVQLFEGCGHILELEAPERFNQHLNRFMSDGAERNAPSPIPDVVSL